jgi:glycerol-3-phosphate acyltransferase PlsY
MLSSKVIAVVAASYLLGSVPVGLIVVRLFKGTDVRQTATNVLRAAGPTAALITALGDACKGFLAVWMAKAAVGFPIVEAICGVMAVVGHNYSVFIGFRGGAGTMTTVGSATGLWPWSAAILVATGVLIIAVTRYASLGSITIALAVPVILALLALSARAPWAYVANGVGTAALTIWALRPNIGRLLAGTERRVALSRR